MASSGDFPVFEVVTGVLTDPVGHERYDEVMHEVHVAKSRRFKILSEAKTSIDPATGHVNVVMEIVDYGPDTQKRPVF